MNAPSKTEPTLTSKWDGLSPHLLASIWPVERAGASHNWQKIEGTPSIKAPLIDANVEMVMGWKSPFEDAGGDRVIPGISSMLRSGALQPWSNSKEGSQTLSNFEGRTGITKLNSTQIFEGMQSIKITATALFRAWSDPASEVMAPVQQLIQWALPQELAPDGPILSLLNAAKEWVEGKPLDQAIAKGMLPSISPSKLALQYKGVLYSPMVIESIGYPIGSPVDSRGRYVELAIPLTICSLAAIDRDDWKRASDGRVLAGTGGFHV